MDIKDYLNEIKNHYCVSIKEYNRQIVIKNSNNEKHLVIEREECETVGSGKAYTEYIVIFQTQHCHFEEPEDVFDYVKEILDDEVIPTEFFDADGKDRFGGEIHAEDFPFLSIALLSKLFRIVPVDLKKLSFECHSWSGKYDLPRQPVSMLTKEIMI